ncbi:MAG TPA: hypothetical protein VJZ27_01035, partial [Aggregatilineales bacterium]|nr:hypothetical protein [Aggregatilineales bacterium]
AENFALYETGTVLRFSEEGSLNYIRADLTPAYNSTVITSAGNQPKVREVMREFVFLRPGTVILHDRIIPTDPGAVIFNMLHTQFEPQQNNDWFTVTGANSALFINQLTPQTTSEVITGFNVAGLDLDSAWGSPLTNEFENEAYGRYRIQFIPATDNPIQHFLTLLIATSKDATPPDAQYVVGDGMYGAALNDWQVMFDDDPGNITATRFEVMPGANNLLFTGLQPLGQYQVMLPDSTDTDVQADDAGTLYIFVEQSGEIRLNAR